MARAARKPKADSVLTGGAEATKPKRTSRKKKLDVLILDDALRVEEPDRWDSLSALDAERVEQIAAAFALNRITGGSVEDRILGLASELAAGTAEFADSAEPAANPERIEAARQRMRELMADGAPTDRIGKANIKWPQREFDAVLENRVREIVRQTVQEMLGGETGQKLSSGIRRMVRREVEAQIALERAS